MHGVHKVLPNAVARAPRGRHEPVPVPCDPAHHPVARAWRVIAPAGTHIDRADLLRPARTKGEIYRLTLGDGATIIAKRKSRDTLLVERAIYESVLPRLPVRTLRYFGFVHDDEESLAWLFIEDAGDERCSLTRHGGLAARWLGSLHGAAAALDPAPSLPERGPAHYLEHLRAGRQTIVDSFGNPTLGADDPQTLRALISSCDLIESRWGEVQAMCDALPRTLVHGDFVDRNLRLKSDAIVAFDWEVSGWGVPAPDVYEFAVNATPDDLSTYGSAIAEYVRGVDHDELQALLIMGKGFRLLASVDWASRHLVHPWPERGMPALRMYAQPLQEWAATVLAAV
jgi:hypothetical protein